MARVNLNFMPVEQRAYILETKLLGGAAAAYVVSAVLFGYVFLWKTGEHRQLTKARADADRDYQQVEAERRAMQFPQDKILRLKQKFEFIKTAMGASDFPWLRFYQSLEDAIPTGESGNRGVFFVRLDGSRTNWTLEGEAESWNDILTFEDRMGKSTYGPDKKNFANVKVLSYKAIEGNRGYRFKMQFNFVETL